MGTSLERAKLKLTIPPHRPVAPTDQWYTPDHVVKSVGEYFGAIALGGIQMDICADPAHRIKAPHHYDGLTAKKDGLTQPWRDGYFGNIPFSKPQDWILKACREKKTGIILAKSGVLHNKSTADEIKSHASAIALWRGRMQFLPGEELLEFRKSLGKGKPMSSDFDVALLLFCVCDRRNIEAFDRVFSPYASIYFSSSA